MSLENIRAQVAAIAAGVDGIGRVHEYVRWATDWKKVIEKFKITDDGGSKINALMITRKKTHRRQRTIGEIELAHVLELKMIMGLNDAEASELIFQKLLDNLAAAFDSDETLNGTCETTRPSWGPMEGQVGLSIDIVDMRMFGGILCHYAECHLCATESIED